ncbi:MAG TPA: PqqD family protein [Rhodothermales bacterium]|nr:PqqD family protein [Rhodothermales bacterium]
MLDLNTYLTPNRDEVVSKVIDGEAIVINLSNGIYYSMDKVAALVWDLIDRQVSVQTIADEVASRYDVAPAQAAADLEKFVAQLAEEKLISETSGGRPADMPGGVTDTPESTAIRYETPVLNIYRDMGDLLALDPPQPGLENTPWRATGDDSADQGRA